MRSRPSATGATRRPGGVERSIPCDLAPKGRWSEEDLARLRAFAATLPADVVALQEIDGEDVARTIFPQHEFCFTKRRQVQNVGFAIRRGLAFRCNRDLRGARPAGRHGALGRRRHDRARHAARDAPPRRAPEGLLQPRPADRGPRRLPAAPAPGAGAGGLDRPARRGRRRLRRARRLQSPLRPGARGRRATPGTPSSRCGRRSTMANRPAPTS